MRTNFGNSEAKLLTGVYAGGSTSANISIIAGIAGQRIRVLGWNAQSGTGVSGVYRFIDGSGGGALTPYTTAPPNTSGILFQQPVIDPGYFETSTGVGLFADFSTAGTNFYVFYITYVP